MNTAKNRASCPVGTHRLHYAACDSWVKLLALIVQQLAAKQLFSMLAAPAASAFQPGKVKDCFCSPFFMLFFLTGPFPTTCPAALVLHSWVHSCPSTCTAQATQALVMGEVSFTATAAAVVSCCLDLLFVAALLPFGAVGTALLAPSSLLNGAK